MFLVIVTLAWSSLNSQSLNEWLGTGNTRNGPGGTLHDDHEADSESKQVYIENWGSEDLFVRVRLSEYMEAGTGAGMKFVAKNPDTGQIIHNPLNMARPIDEAHLLSYEMLEETRFLLNYKMDSQNPMGLIVAGQSELRVKLSKEIFEPITQRIDFRFKIPAMDLSQTTEYISRHMSYAGESRQIFTNGAVQKIFSYANGIPRKINKVCYLSLMAAAQRQTRLIEDSLVAYVIDQELTW